MITSFFDTDWRIFGQEATRKKKKMCSINTSYLHVCVAYSQCGWEDIEPGRHEYPFALKVNNGI